MVSKHGFAKILDFGLAKLVTPEDQEVSALQTAAGDATRPGMVMGTVGYMSPEQAAGRPLDFRSDQFSFGSILYEMATGKRAFERGTTAETLTAIIREEPESVAQLNPQIPRAGALARRALPVQGSGGPLRHDEGPRARPRRRARPSLRGDRSRARRSARPRRRGAEAPAGPGRSALARGSWRPPSASRVSSGEEVRPRRAAVFRQLTFQRGEIYSARFAPDGQTILYSASWEGRPVEIFVTRLDSPESRPFGLDGRRRPRDVARRARWPSRSTGASSAPFMRSGTLARIGDDGRRDAARGARGRPVGGLDARRRSSRSSATSGRSPSRVSDRQGRSSRPTGWLSNLRVSPDGDSVAFLDHPRSGDDGGSVARRRPRRQDDGRSRATSRRRAASPGRPTAGRSGSRRRKSAAIARSTPCRSSGAARLLARVTGNLTLQDVARDGRVLVAHDSCARESWRGTRATTRSATCRGSTGRSRTRHVAGRKVLRLQRVGRGRRSALLGVLAEASTARRRFVSATGTADVDLSGREVGRSRISGDRRGASSFSSRREPGSRRRFATEGLTVQARDGFPDGKRILITASEAGRGARLYLLDGRGRRSPAPISRRRVTAVRAAVSPDGKLAVGDRSGPAGRISTRSGRRAAAGARPRGRREARGLDAGRPIPLRVQARRSIPRGSSASTSRPGSGSSGRS